MHKSHYANVHYTGGDRRLPVTIGSCTHDDIKLYLTSMYMYSLHDCHNLVKNNGDNCSSDKQPFVSTLKIDFGILNNQTLFTENGKPSNGHNESHKSEWSMCCMCIII